MTKRGKEIKLELSSNYNIVCGTIDNKNAKAIYVNISAWGEPTVDLDLDYGRIISKLSKCIKQSTYNYLTTNYADTFYVDRTIVDLDMRESGIKIGKRSFMNCEITLFQKSSVEFSSINDEILNKIIEKITMESISCLDKFDNFIFNKKKI